MSTSNMFFYGDRSLLWILIRTATIIRILTDFEKGVKMNGSPMLSLLKITNRWTLPLQDYRDLIV